MARAGAVLVDTLALLQERIRPGVSTAQLDQLAERFIRSRGAVPTFKGYRGFPGSICASPNAMIVHGIPGPYRLAEGDIISVDVGVTQTDAIHYFDLFAHLFGFFVHHFVEGLRLRLHRFLMTDLLAVHRELERFVLEHRSACGV